MAEINRLERLQKEMDDLKLKMREESKRLKEQEKKNDQRRKFLAGAILLQHAEANPEFKVQLETVLRAHVQDGDKHLWPELFAANDNAPADIESDHGQEKASSAGQ